MPIQTDVKVKVEKKTGTQFLSIFLNHFVTLR